MLNNVTIIQLSKELFSFFKFSSKKLNTVQISRILLVFLQITPVKQKQVVLKVLFIPD
jgi:hypothetical protein